MWLIRLLLVLVRPEGQQYWSTREAWTGQAQPRGPWSQLESLQQEAHLEEPQSPESLQLHTQHRLADVELVPCPSLTSCLV